MTHKIQTFHDFRYLKEHNYTLRDLKEIYVLFKLKWKQRKNNSKKVLTYGQHTSTYNWKELCKITR